MSKAHLNPYYFPKKKSTPEPIDEDLDEDLDEESYESNREPIIEPNNKSVIQENFLIKRLERIDTDTDSDAVQNTIDAYRMCNNYGDFEKIISDISKNQEVMDPKMVEPILFNESGEKIYKDISDNITSYDNPTTYDYPTIYGGKTKKEKFIEEKVIKRKVIKKKVIKEKVEEPKFSSS